MLVNMYVYMRLPGQGLALQCLQGEVIAVLCMAMPRDRSQSHGLSGGGVVKHKVQKTVQAGVFCFKVFISSPNSLKYVDLWKCDVGL